MSRCYRRLFFFGLLLLGACLSGCKAPEEVVQFHQKIADAHWELQKVGEKLNSALKKALQTDGTADEFETARQAALKDVEELVKQTKAWNPPADEASSKLYAAHQEFLKVQEALLKDDCQQIKTVLADTSLTKEKRLEQVVEIVQKMKKAETAEYEKLLAVQKTFAEAHRIKLSSESSNKKS